MAHAALLLGAGSSQPAGFPSTQDLTNRLLSGQGIIRHTDSTYYLNDNSGASSEGVRLVVSAARLLHAEAARYFAAHADRQPNYEDVYYLARQVSDAVQGEMENPATWPFVQSLRTNLVPLIEAFDAPGLSNFEAVVDECANFIHDVVWRSLVAAPSSVEHLRPISRIFHSDALTLTTIATLCHDSHLESHLRDSGLALSDGFAAPEEGVRYWSRSLPLECPTPFLKLHGSVDWFRLRPDAGDWHDERTGIPLDGDHEHTRTSEGLLQHPVPPRPMLLIGTFNKISDYSSQHFLDLHHWFRASIDNAERLAICGYGFGDKGINAALIDWYYRARGRRFVVVHPDPESLVRFARGAVRNKWSEWRDANSVVIVPKRLEDLDEHELESALIA